MGYGIVGQRAPAFTAKAVVNGSVQENFSLAALQGRYVIFFFYPLDFTFVCPTELHAFQDQLVGFRERGAEVVGCSVDSCFAHLAWLSQPRLQGGIQGVTYPLVADLTKSIARDYAVLKEEEGVAYRALFLIDREGVVRHALVNDLPLGRSVDEALRMLDALIFFEEHGEVCPANWQAGSRAMKATPEGLRAYCAASNQRL